MRSLFYSYLLLVTCSLSGHALADSWPQFRGPNGDGITTAMNVPVHFGEDDSVAWKTEIPGRGWSSPVLEGNSIWLTTAIEIFPDEEERIQLLIDAGEEEKKFKQKQVARSIELALLEIDYTSGELLRQINLAEIDKPDPIHNLNSYSSPTPVLADGKVIAHFGTFGTFCLDAKTGKPLWERRIELEHSVGPGSSPFVCDNLVFLICDGVDRQFVTALDLANGETAWSTDRPEMRAPIGEQKKAYNTPILIEGPTDRRQLICMGSQWLVSYDPETGEEFWRLDHGSGFSVVPRPVYSEEHDLLYISTGFGKPELLAVHTDGVGDVTASHKIAWRDPKRIPAKPSPLLYKDRLYLISDGGITTCFAAQTGEVIWNGRIDGNYSASPLLAGGNVYVASQEGKVTVFEPGDTYKELASNQLEGSIMASPIALDGTLIIRTDSALYRFAP